MKGKGKVIKFQEKPQASSGLINGGYMVFNEKLLDYLSIKEECDLEFGAIEKLTKKDEVMVYKHKGTGEVWIMRDMLFILINYGLMEMHSGKNGIEFIIF